MSLPTSPPLLPGDRSQAARPILATILSLVLILFLGSAALSLVSDALILFLHRHELAVTATFLLLLMLALGIVTCGLMALFPAIPKRFFLPISLYIPVVGIAVLPLLVYFHRQAPLTILGLSFAQLLLGLFILHRLQRGWNFHWPLFPERLLADRKFIWGNLVGVMLTVLLLVPALGLYAAFSAKLAIAHFTDGFLDLRPSGLAVQVRHYLRDDGKKIMLVPMSHVGAPEFYRDLAASFPNTAVVLMEGVTDHRNVVPKGMDYSRLAASVGGVEQVEAFQPPGEIVPADVDISSFSPATLDLLKVAMLVHQKGVTAETLPFLMKPTPPGFEVQLMEDLLTKRNRHLLGVLEKRLPTSEHIIVPWGAAHMPEIAREIQKLGFRVVATQDFVAIRFGR